MADVSLSSVYGHPDRFEILFALMKERTKKVNISHRALPSWKDHVKFVESRPYKAWYFILGAAGEVAGGVYLSKTAEIGVFVFRKHRGRGYGPRAVELLMKKHPEKRFLANINPKNEASIEFFENMGFRHIQNTYELIPTKKRRRP